MGVSIAGQRPSTERHWKLYVAMLSRNTNEDDLQAMFEPYGKVLEVYLMRRDNGVSKGSAFVKYGTREEALRAIDALHETIKDKDAAGLLQCRFAHTKEEKLQKQTTK
eukprot:TRINITY_DN3254_c0_g1_i1.p1 TRINITY_DN3254_c0_g1~~TRINITY_DN3254_c0_g1_i1.p1  ORF type:complete len:108 (-),score=20.52 TRINITY_DN3254_c0_g1_i1:110-433(-)